MGRKVVGFASAMSFAVGMVSCEEPVDPDFEVPADSYVASFCEQRCELSERCDGPDFEGDDVCNGECLTYATENMVDQPGACFERLIEFGRCRFERLPCEEFIREPGESLEEAEDSPCRDAYEVWKACD